MRVNNFPSCFIFLPHREIIENFRLKIEYLRNSANFKLKNGRVRFDVGSEIHQQSIPSFTRLIVCRQDIAHDDVIIVIVPEPFLFVLLITVFRLRGRGRVRNTILNCPHSSVGICHRAKTNFYIVGLKRGYFIASAARSSNSCPPGTVSA